MKFDKNDAKVGSPGLAVNMQIFTNSFAFSRPQGRGDRGHGSGTARRDCRGQAGGHEAVVQPLKRRVDLGSRVQTEGVVEAATEATLHGETLAIK